jgi:hypothetical protein
MVVVSTFTTPNTTPTLTDAIHTVNALQPLSTLHTTNEPAQMALLGIVPLAPFLQQID